MLFMIILKMKDLAYLSFFFRMIIKPNGFGDIKLLYYVLYFKLDVHSFDSQG
jgi:hypothetical protein